MNLDLTTLVDSRIVDRDTVRLARHLGFLYNEQRELVIAAAACAITVLANGSVCFDLTRANQLRGDLDPPPVLDWPDPDDWADLLRSSPMVATDPTARDRPLVIDQTAVYLTRYWAEQQSIVEKLATRLQQAPPTVDGLNAALNQVFTAASNDQVASPQREAAHQAARSWFSVIAGGPGTGKTTVVARILAVLAQTGSGSHNGLRVTLTAPTGRAAARLDQAVRENLAESGVGALVRCRSGTLHRILGLKPWGAVDHDATNPLAADVVVVDEASMLSLHLMAVLLDAVGPNTRLILLGDADQLASVEAGVVLADIVANEGTVPVTRLVRTFRFAGDIADLAEAIRRGAEDEAISILEKPSDMIEWCPTDLADTAALASLRADVTQQSLALIAASQSGNAVEALRLLDSHRLLVAHRRGSSGVGHWTQTVRGWIADQPGSPSLSTRWYPGLPVLITRNDDLMGVFNGDCGVIVRCDDDLKLAIDNGSGVRLISPDMVEAWEPLYTSTIHKSQGSQYDRVSLILPGPTTALLTRELFYTAVTRAKTFLRIIGTTAAARHAIASPALRASGLANQLSNSRRPD